jgi:glycosyltransferase involved in cell wall biosynthesis
MKISFCTIILNEEDNIKSLIENINDVGDEIIIIDSGSTDNGVKIAENMGAKVIYNKWTDYSSQKNFAISKASNEWVFVIDADERLSDELKKNIKKVKEHETDKEGFLIARKSFYLGRWINHSGWYPERRIRFFKKSKGKYYGKFVHEGLAFNGDSKILSGDLLHYSYKDINDHIERLNRYSFLGAKRKKEEGKKFSFAKLLLSPLIRFITHYFIRFGFLDGFQGFLIAVFSGYYVFLREIKLWEISKQ